MSIYIKIGGNVQGHASFKHHHGWIQDACKQSGTNVKRSRLERAHPDDGLLANAIIDSQLHDTDFTSTGFRDIQALLSGKALWSAIDSAAAVG